MIENVHWAKKVFAVVLVLFIGYATFFVVADLFSQSQKTTPLPEEEARRILAMCADLAEDGTAHEQCTAQGFADAGERWGFTFIGTVLAAYQEINQGYQSYQNCHVLAHRIMNDWGTRAPGKWKEIVQQMDGMQLDPNRCGGGFVHGMLEARTSEDPDLKVDKALFQELCVETFHQSSDCAHILGHFALIEVFGEVEESFKSCDGLTGDFLFRCYGGIFMEDTMRTNLEAHGLAELPERNMEWFETNYEQCKRYADTGVIASACWYVLSEVFAQTHGYDLEKTYEFCTKAPSKEAIDECYIRTSWVVALVSDMLFETFPSEALCAAYAPGSRELDTCMRDVVGALLGYSTSFVGSSVSFCSARPDMVKNQCFDLISENVARSGGTANQKKTLCDALPEQNRTRCSTPS